MLTYFNENLNCTQDKQNKFSGVVEDAHNISTWEAEKGSEFKGSLSNSEKNKSNLKLCSSTLGT